MFHIVKKLLTVLATSLSVTVASIKAIQKLNFDLTKKTIRKLNPCLTK